MGVNNLTNIGIDLCEGAFKYETLISLLQSDNIAQKQFAALELSEIKSNEDAILLVSNLTGQDGKVREAVSYKINDLCQNQELIVFFLNPTIFDQLLQGIMDINGNVCRYIVQCNIIETYEFKSYLSKKLPESIANIINDIDASNADLKPFHQKRYVVSKRNFQLYWCLEALFTCVEDIEVEQLKDILLWCGEFYDYTIREKTAKILTKIDHPELSVLKEKLKNDENFYVRRYLNQ